MLLHNFLQSVRFWKKPASSAGLLGPVCHYSANPFLNQRFCYFADGPSESGSSDDSGSDADSGSTADTDDTSTPADDGTAGTPPDAGTPPEDTTTTPATPARPEVRSDITSAQIAEACRDKLDAATCEAIAAETDSNEALGQAFTALIASGIDNPAALFVEKGLMQPESAVPGAAAETTSQEVTDKIRGFRGQFSNVMGNIGYQAERLKEVKSENLKKFQAERKKMQPLVNEGNRNWETLENIINHLVESGNINTQQASHILSLFPAEEPTLNAARIKKYLNTELKPFRNQIPSSKLKHIIILKVHQWEVDQKITAQMDKINEVLAVESERFNEERFKETQYRILERCIGFAPRPAEKTTGPQSGKSIPVTRIRYLSEGKWKEASVDSVQVQYTEYDKKLKVPHKRSGKEPGDKTITHRSPTDLIITLSNGQPFSGGRFRRWAEETQAQELITDHAQLEEKLHLTELGMKLQPGVVIEYSAREADETGKVQDEQRLNVAIQNITADGKIVLENAIRLPYYPNETKNTFDFSEFSRFFRSTKASFKINRLGSPDGTADDPDLRGYLRKHKADLDQKYSRDKDLYKPIEVKKGEKLQFGDNYKNRFKITDVDEDGGRVKIRDFPWMTNGEFLRWVRDNDVEKFDPDREAEQTRRMMKDAGYEPEKVEKEVAEKRQDLDDADKADEKSAADAEEWQRKNKEKMKEQGLDLPDTAPKVQEDFGASSSYLEELWDDTTMLSLQDIIQVGKTFKEMLVRRHGTKSRYRGAQIGKHLPGSFGLEYEKDCQQAENEEVDHYKQAMSQWGIWQIRDTLHIAKDRFQLKACLITLVEKGQMRWDDPKFWASLNKHIPPHLRVTPHRAKLKDVTPEDLIEGGIDYLYGESQYSDWHKSNGDTFNGEKKKFTWKGDQLEGGAKGKGLIQEMQKLLTMHMRGEYVNPQEYEGMIDFAINKGKARVIDKMYFIIEGVCRRNHRGETLLNLDRIGSLDGEFLNRLPWLDFLVDKDFAKFSGEEGGRPWTVKDFEKVADYFDSAAPKPGEEWGPNENVVKFFWQVANQHHKTYVRMGKGIRAGEDIDHDDWNFIGALMDAKDAEYLSNKHGVKSRLTNAGIRNVYPGFNQQLKSLGDMDPALVDMFAYDVPVFNNAKKLVKGFVTFDSILMDRLNKGSNQYFRLSQEEINMKTVVDPEKTVGDHQSEMYRFLKNLISAYQKEFSEILREQERHASPRQKKFYAEYDYDYFKILQAKTDPTHEDYKERQEFIESNIKMFCDNLDRAIGTDQKRFIKVIQDTQLSGQDTEAYHIETPENTQEGESSDDASGASGMPFDLGSL